MKLLKGYYAYLAVSGGLLLGLAAQNNWALQMLAFALVSAGALSVQNVSRWYMRASIAADVTMAFKLILGPALPLRQSALPSRQPTRPACCGLCCSMRHSCRCCSPAACC